MCRLLSKFIGLTFVLFSLDGSSQDISYYYDEQSMFSIATLDKIQFTPVEEAINNGLNKGIYWIKINNSKSSAYVIEIPNNHINELIVYQNNEIIKQLPSHRFSTIQVLNNHHPVILKINSQKEAFIPIELYSTDEFLKHEQSQGVFIGLFYGFALMVAIINIFYYFNFRDKSFLLYALFLLSIGAVFSHRDGLVQILGFSRSFAQYFESFVHSFSGLLGAIFASDYLQIKSNYPRIRYSFFVVIVIAIVFDFLYVITGDFNYFVLSDLFTYYIFIGCWFISVLLFRKYTYAVFFCIAYSLLVLMTFAFFISPIFGFSNFGVDANNIKLGGYLEMLIISYAVVYRMGILQTENDQMNSDILDYTNQIQSLSKELAKNQKGVKNYFTQFDLSLRENEILELLTQNKSNKEIAKALNVSANTVKYHIKNIYQKLQIKSRKEVHSVINNP